MIDLVIVGTGPAALTAAIYAARDGLRVVLYEKEAIGGIITTSELVENYPGFIDGISGYELGSKMRKQAERFGAEIKYGEVTNVVKNDDYIKIIIDDDEEILAKTVLLSPGNSYRKLGIEKEAELSGKGVHFCATCDGPFYQGQDVIAVGGGDTAIEDSLFLSKFSKVKLIVRSQIKAQKILQDKLRQAEKEGKIEVYLGSEIEEILTKEIDDNKKVTGVKIRQDGKITSLDGAAIFEFIGLIPNTLFLENTDINLNKYGEIIVDDNFSTNIAGIYAAGDAIIGAEKQLVIAAASGASAALKIRQFLSKN